MELNDILNPKWSNKTLSINTLKEEISANISRISEEYEQIRRMYQDSPLLTPIVNKFIEKKELSPALVYAAQLEADFEREQKRKAEMESRRRENAENTDSSCSKKYSGLSTAFSLLPLSVYRYKCRGRPATASDRIRTQEYTAVICMALRSVTVLPEVEPPK